MEMASSNVAAEGSKWRGDEVVARVMSRQILAALMHIHRHNLAHRDVKANNILVFMSSTGSPTFKLADFGCAENIVPAGHFHPDLSSGIPAIEIQRRETGVREHADMMDIYGFGLVLYGMLTQGSLPDVHRFDSLSARYEAAMRWKPENGRSRALSRAAMVFIDSLLASNPRARPDAEQMLKHTWLKTRMDVPDIAAQEPAISSVPDIEKEAGELPSSGDETARSFSQLSVSRGRNHRVEPYPVRESLTLHAGHTPSNVGSRQGVIRTGQNLSRGTFHASNRPFLAGDVRYAVVDFRNQYARHANGHRFPRLVDQYRAGFAVSSRQRRNQ